MESPFYGYYHFKTVSPEVTWSTQKLRNFFLSYGGFSQEQGNFRHTEAFCRLQLLNVKSFDSWSSHDYDVERTNYIAITSSKKLPPVMEQLFQDLEALLGVPPQEGNDGEVNS